jgi:hypothetical protein
MGISMALHGLSLLQHGCISGRIAPMAQPKKKPEISPDERRRRAAGLLGAGLSTARVADQLGITERGVRKLRQRIENDDELRGILEEARRQHMPEVLEVAGIALETMRRGLEREDCPVHHAAAAYREVSRAVEVATGTVSPKPAGEKSSIGALSGRIAAELLVKLKEHEDRNARPEKASEYDA